MNQRTSQPLNSALRRRQLRTKKSRWSLPPDLVLSVATTLVLSLLTRVDVLEPIRFVAGLAVGLVIPGYLLVAWVFPKPDSLKGWERMGVILAINISIIIIMGLLMALLKIPFTTMSITNTLTGLILILAGVVFWVRQNDPSLGEPFDFSLLKSKAVAGMLIVMLGISGIVWYVVGTNLHKQYTAFSLTNTQGQLNGYPYTLTPGQHDPMRLNIFNPSSSVKHFVIIERTPATLISKTTVKVAPGQHWFQIFDLPTAHVGSLVHLHFLLTTMHGKTIRQLWITYHVTP